MEKLVIVRRSGKLEEIWGVVAINIVDKIRRYGINYPDYLTDEEMGDANISAAYFDRLATESEFFKERTKKRVA